MDGTWMQNAGDILTIMIREGKMNTGLAVLLFISFMLLSAMTVMNMLIGILCEVVSAVAAQEKEDHAIALIKDTILAMLMTFDEDGNGLISKKELQHVMEDATALDVLQSLEVHVHYMMELQDMLYEEEDAE